MHSAPSQLTTLPKTTAHVRYGWWKCRYCPEQISANPLMDKRRSLPSMTPRRTHTSCTYSHHLPGSLRYSAHPGTCVAPYHPWHRDIPYILYIKKGKHASPFTDSAYSWPFYFLGHLNSTRYSYAASACFALSAIFVNAVLSCIARSANTLRSMAISAFDRPLIKRL